MIYFDQIDIVVDGTGILCEGFALDSTNTLSPAYSVGYKGTINQIPTDAIKNTIKINYLPKLDNEPIFAQINKIKTITGSSYTEYSGINIIFGGVTGRNCFLDTFNLQSSPNQLVRGNASFTTYFPLSGTLRAKPSNTTIQNLSGQIPHGWTTHIISGTSYLTAPVYDFSYDFSADWEPTYILGNEEPIQIDLLQGSERMTFLRDIYHHVQFSGETPQNESSNSLIHYVVGDEKIDILKYDFLSNTSSTNQGIVITLSGYKIKSSNLNASMDDFVKTVTEITNYF